MSINSDMNCLIRFYDRYLQGVTPENFVQHDSKGRECGPNYEELTIEQESTLLSMIYENCSRELDGNTMKLVFEENCKIERMPKERVIKLVNPAFTLFQAVRANAFFGVNKDIISIIASNLLKINCSWMDLTSPGHWSKFNEILCVRSLSERVKSKAPMTDLEKKKLSDVRDFMAETIYAYSWNKEPPLVSPLDTPEKYEEKPMSNDASQEKPSFNLGSSIFNVITGVGNFLNNGINFG